MRWGMDGYTPSLPFGVANPNVSAARLLAGQGGGTTPWEAAPGTSHILRWRWFDVRQVPFLRKFPGQIGQGRSELHVQFKGKNNTGSSAVYAYFYDNPEAGEVIVQKLRASPHPYGEVLHPLVIKGGVPYTKVHG